MKRGGNYVRVSTTGQLSEEGSLVSQLQRLREELERRSRMGEEHKEVCVYADEAESGQNLNRPKFIQMVRDIKAGKIDIVLCTELSRVSRSVMDFLSFMRFLQEHNVGFICLKQNFDTTTPHGKVLMTICVALAEFERELVSERTAENLLARAKRGLRNGGAVLGLDSNPERRGWLIPNEMEKATVNMGFQKYLEIGSINGVADFLNSNGHRTKRVVGKESGKIRKAQKFTPQSVHYMLTNRAYIGEVEINRMNKNKDQATLPERNRYGIAKAVWEGIVPRDVFIKVQKLMRENGQTRRNTTNRVLHNFLLRTLVTCGKCGRILEDGSGTSKTGELYFYYRHKHGRRCKGCDLPSLRADMLEKLVMSRLDHLASNAALLSNITKAANARLSKELPNLNDLLAVRRQEYAKIGREIDRWKQKILDVDSQDVTKLIMPEINKLKAQQDQVVQEVRDLETQVSDIKTNSTTGLKLCDLLRTFKTLFDQLTPNKQRELIAYLVKGVTVNQNSVELSIYGRPDLEQFELVGGVFAACQSNLPD